MYTTGPIIHHSHSSCRCCNQRCQETYLRPLTRRQLRLDMHWLDTHTNIPLQVLARKNRPHTLGGARFASLDIVSWQLWLQSPPILIVSFPPTSGVPKGLIRRGGAIEPPYLHGSPPGKHARNGELFHTADGSHPARTIYGRSFRYIPPRQHKHLLCYKSGIQTSPLDITRDHSK